MLSSTLIVRGHLRYGEPKAVSLPQSTVKQGVNPVVSQPPKGIDAARGRQSTRSRRASVFVLTGDLIAYRDLRPGDSGVDVHQLEDALARSDQHRGDERAGA